MSKRVLPPNGTPTSPIDLLFQLEARSKPIRLISTSDWHFGNRRVSANDLAIRFRQYLFPHLKHCDLLNIGGDIWDTLLNLSEDTNIIEAFLIDLMNECNKHRITVRILLGTYSHDRSQSSLIPILHEKCGFTNDLRYIDRVYLEEITALNLRILYLPDDLPYASSQDCMEVVEDMMRQRGWTYVDYVFGHGYFDHMLPTNLPRKPRCTFLIEQFKPFVRRYVCMGHVHQCNFTENVFYNNSFDRLAHGEEEPKGYMSIIDYGDRAQIEFIENKDATKFITFDLSQYFDHVEIGRVYIDRVTKAFGDEPGYVRIIHPSSEIRQALQRITSSQFPKLVYSVKKNVDTTAVDLAHAHRKLLDVKTYPSPTEETLPEMVHAFLAGMDRTELSVERIAELLA